MERAFAVSDFHSTGRGRARNDRADESRRGWLDDGGGLLVNNSGTHQQRPHDRDRCDQRFVFRYRTDFMADVLATTSIAAAHVHHPLDIYRSRFSDERSRAFAFLL